MATTNNSLNYKISQYNVLVGAANNLVTNIAPSSTSGVPFISNGASSNPGYGTAVVAGGGTGLTSTTAYELIAGGTTSTGNLQQVSGVGTVGQVLASNGAGSLPSWQSAPAGVFSPNQVLQIVEDFIGGTGGIPSSNFAGCNFMWSINSSSAAVTWNSAGGGAVAGHPGIWYQSGLNSSNTYVCLALQSANNTFILGSGVIVLNWVFNIGTLSNGTNRYVLNIGLGDTYNSKVADQANGLYFKYSDNVNSGNWEIVSASASSLTTTTTSTAVTTGWHNAQITIDSTASTITYVMDGVSLGTISTHIPTTAVSPLYYIEWVAGTIGSSFIGVDLMYLTQVLTTAR